MRKPTIGSPELFSSTATYAVRALAHLAERPADEAILGRDLAELADVPANYLSKILLILKRAGMVEATRGMGGGYRLSRPATEVSLGEVFELFDPPSSLPDCLLGRPRCSEADPCPAHERWCRVKAVYSDFLNQTTLAEITCSATARVSPSR